MLADFGSLQIACLLFLRVSITLIECLAMVQILDGIIVTCDPQMLQFLLHLNETKALGQTFVLQEIDSTHLLVSPDIITELKNRIDDLMDQFSFVEVN